MIYSLQLRSWFSLNISLSRFYFCSLSMFPCESLWIPFLAVFGQVCTGKAVCYSIYFDVIYIS